MIYIGIDCGLSGSIAYICDDQTVIIHDTPVVETGKGRAYDLRAMLLTFPANESTAAIEEQGPRPGMGVRAMFTLGLGFGLWQMALASRGISMRRVRPQEWKKEFNLIGTNKDASRLRAIELFPFLESKLKRKKDDGRAEAILIAEWLRRQEARQERQATIAKVPRSEQNA